ncbi:prolipoprotein diacylglyceryl transferase [Nonomuraea sp. NBC_01738]|uniref:prolipoprotein diacylglyceryl transferase n=1 Tax=Nonomuraea sp. NBC_01738 TaxID=2976003 RepID=UPI002E0F4AD7|nr:prolipoprotein diacylglyceryl transferase [Nonomuraea sp. NBC_01738]
MPLVASIPSPPQGVWYLGPIPIRAYALCIVAGVIVAVWLSERRWRARGGAPGTIIDIAVPAVIFGLIGGRLYHVITDWQLYFGPDAPNKPYEALFIWNGGLGIWGAIALGAFGVWLSVRKRGISLTAIADTVAPGIAIAQAIGRWGNWFNQELYGGETTLPWGLEIDKDKDGIVDGLFHPTFLYESIWDLALAFVLIWAGKRFALRHGRLFALYVAGYTLGRFWIEGLRIDPVGGIDHAVTFLGLRINQWTSIVLFVAALVYFWATRNKDTPEYVLPRDLRPAPDAGATGDDDADPAHGAEQADAADSADDGDRAESPPGERAEATDAATAADDTAADVTAADDTAVTDGTNTAVSADAAENADAAESADSAKGADKGADSTEAAAEAPAERAPVAEATAEDDAAESDAAERDATEHNATEVDASVKADDAVPAVRKPVVQEEEKNAR